MPDNSARLLELARREFAYLTEADLEVLHCVAAGKVADLARWDPFTPRGGEQPLPNPLRSVLAQAPEPPRAPLRSQIVEWLCTDSQATTLVHRKGICIENATFSAQLDLDSASVPFGIELVNCCLPRFSVRLGKVKGNLRVAGCSISGLLDFYGAEIHGQILLDGTRLYAAAEITLCGDELICEGISFATGFHTQGAVQLLGANITGSLSCSGGTFQGSSGIALSLDRAAVAGSVFLNKGFRARGEVRLLGSNIKSSLYCSGGRFRNFGSDAISMDGASIGGDVDLDDGFLARGEVRMPGVKISGDLVCRGGRFINIPNKTLAIPNYAIYASCANIAGRVFLDNGFQAIGEVYFRSAEVHRHFNCIGGEFCATKWCALNAFCCTFGDSLMLLPQTVQGKIDLCRANIANDLTTTGAITLQNCELDLSGAKIGRLCDSEDSWPGPGKLHLDGFEYESIQRAAPTTANARLAWLKRQPEESFQTQPYEQLAAWYHRAGHDSFARDIRIAKERARLRQWLSILSKSYWREVGAKLGIKSKRPGSSAQTASRPWKLYFKEPCKRFWWWVKDIIVGYGYKPHFALIWLAAIWLLGAAVFGHAYPEGMTQSASYKYATPEQNQTDLDNNTQPLGLMLSTNYPAFNPLIYSLDVALPIVDLQQERYWMPNSSVPEGRGLWWFNWFEVLMGWFLASMGIAGATGIIRKD